MQYPGRVQASDSMRMNSAAQVKDGFVVGLIDSLLQEMFESSLSAESAADDVMHIKPSPQCPHPYKDPASAQP